MWIRIRAVIIEDEPLAVQYLAALLDDTCQVEVVGSAAESEASLRLCAELRPDAVFVERVGLAKTEDPGAGLDSITVTVRHQRRSSGLCKLYSQFLKRKRSAPP
jgi:DNA-binding NarL/FixJ family response regulator